MADRIIVEGDTRLTVTLRAAAARIRALRAGTADTAQWVEGRGRADAPRASGRLAASVRSTTPDDGPEIGSGLPYANRVHWGYRRYNEPARPFIASAVWDGEAQISDFYMSDIETTLNAVKGA